MDFNLSRLFRQDSSITAPEDFSRFYEQTHLAVFRYLMVLCGGSQTEAEDVTAEAFLRAWQKRAQFSGSEAARLGWLITIARNLLIDQRRAGPARNVALPLDETLADPAVSPEELAVGSEDLQAVIEAMQDLPFGQRNMLTLRYVLGWRVKAIAAHLGLPENTVSVELRRALARLQAQLIQQEANPRRANPHETKTNA